MNTPTILTLLTVIIQLSLGIFVKSNCRSNRDCPRLSSGSGECRSYPDLLCQLTGGRNCNKKICINCRNDGDCGKNKYCIRNGECLQKPNTGCYRAVECKAQNKCRSSYDCFKYGRTKCDSESGLCTYI